MAKPTDEFLISAVGRGEVESLSVLIDRYEPRLLRFVHSLGMLATEDVEDIVQETFVKVYENARGFDPSLKFSSWVYRIARNNTYSWFRRQKARPQAVLEIQDLAHRLAADCNLEQVYISKEAATELGVKLKQLSEQYLEILILRYFEDLSYQEISDVLKIPVSTVSTRLQRAKEALKKIYERQT